MNHAEIIFLLQLKSLISYSVKGTTTQHREEVYVILTKMHFVQQVCRTCSQDNVILERDIS